MITFTKGDNVVPVILRKHSPAPLTKVSGIRAKSPDVAIPDSSLSDAKVYFVSGRFQPGENKFHPLTGRTGVTDPITLIKYNDPVGGREKILGGGLEIRGSQTVIAFEPKNDDPRLTLRPNAAASIDVFTQVKQSANNGDKLAKWMVANTPIGNIEVTGPPFVPAGRLVAAAEDQSIAAFFNTISTFVRDYEHAEYKASKASNTSNSIVARGLLGYQEKYGEFKLTFACRFQHYNAWTLTGEVTNGVLGVRPATWP